ncbi:MAG: hypothetical protein MJ240_01180 [Kiritimatiellae bacterium]|nr:hypothetical protein [Kiritimatiellia bacterium]
MNRRRGSALLIVLGFLSFMVVSAVAFSIFMRSERVPSSVFRRNVQSRQLVKAALARAMSEIDDAIRNDKFPGLTTDSSRKMNNCDRTDGGGDRYFDSWRGRIFMPPNPDMKMDGKYDGNFMASEDDTVSVVTLEGLGYVPPPLLNDVRFLARSSWSSKWRTFNYGAGRFAYCAVNVSDYLDVNRVLANVPRSSSNRVNLASLFAQDFKGEQEGVSTADALGSFVSSRGNAHSQWPFVSMLDYALALKNGYAGLSQWQSAFYRWCSSTRSTMYDPGSDTAADQPFVTDSWLPPNSSETRGAAAIVDLNDRQENDNGGQPFPERSWMEGGKSFEQLTLANSKFARRVANGQTPDGKGGQNKTFLPVTYAMLYDYLARDDMPVSLALPCVERVPMVTGVSIQNLSLNLTLQANAGAPTTTPTAGGGSTTITITDYVLPNSFVDQLNAVKAQVSFLFPFKRAGELNKTFSARALLRIFLTENGASGLRIGGGKALAGLRPQDGVKSDHWTKCSAFSLPGVNSPLPPIVFTLASNPVSLSMPTSIREQDDASFHKEFSFQPITALPVQALLTKQETVNTAAPVPPATTGVPAPPVVEWKFSATPFKADGDLLYTSSAYQPEADFVAAYAANRYTVQASLWIAIEDAATGDVVDLVPAIAADDNIYNGVNNNFVAMEGYDGFNNAGVPLFRFKSMTETTPGATPDTFFTLSGAAVDHPQAYFAVDPRYNWAPEDYLPVNKQATGNNWIDWVLGSDNGMDSLLGEDGHDSDIFMFVSNQGFLQSMGELAFLPRVTDFGNQAAAGASGPTDMLARNGKYNGVEHATSDTWRSIPNANCVWRTYQPYANGGDNLLNFKNFPSGAMAFRDFGARGFRVNPYTDNDAILMTAFAYTPYDWWAAAGMNSPNWQTTNSKDSFSQRSKGHFEKLEYSRKYTFHENSSEAKIGDDKIRTIARKIRDEIRNNPNQSWESVYDGLDWYGNVEPDDESSFKNFLGVQVEEPLHGVDRKYLYAFWRNCLANRQQLFLVFLRAESMALGGSGEGQIPPQQGGHAVALVWRDPENPCNPSTGVTLSQDGNTSINNWVPHRMRVLFFHQFD